MLFWLLFILRDSDLPTYQYSLRRCEITLKIIPKSRDFHSHSTNIDWIANQRPGGERASKPAWFTYTLYRNTDRTQRDMYGWSSILMQLMCTEVQPEWKLMCIGAYWGSLGLYTSVEVEWTSTLPIYRSDFNIRRNHYPVVTRLNNSCLRQILNFQSANAVFIGKSSTSGGRILWVPTSGWRM